MNLGPSSGAITRILTSVILFVPASAATLRVGPSGQFSKPCAAFAAAADGDTIEIDAAGTYAGDVCFVPRSNLTIRGVGGRPKIDAAGQNAGGKATWVIQGRDTLVENIEFTGSTVPDKNGAGIRQEGANLTVRNCYFHHNENGILESNVAGSEILIEYSEFAENGYGDGYSHNMYIGHVAKFTLRFCYSHHSREGHLVKSRAAENYILYNRLTDEETGTGSFELDLPNGGRSYVIGNVIQQGPNSHNATIVNYRAEGPDDRNPSTELFVVNNTIINNRLSGTNIFIYIDAGVSTAALIRNNIFVGPGTLSTQASSVLANNLTVADPRFMDPSHYNYRLRHDSAAIDAGLDPGTGAGMPLAPAFEYVHPACGEGRTAVGAIDAGAFEFGGARFNASAPERCRQIDTGGIVNSANFQAGQIAPGSIFSIFGSNLATADAQANVLPLPQSLAGASVTVNGVSSPLFYASPTQINAQVPFEVQAGPANAVVTVAGIPTSPASFEVAAAAPALFLWSGNRAITQNEDWTLNTGANPAKVRSQIIAYLTGQGAITEPVATGAAAPSDRLIWAALPYSATIGGLMATVEFLGLTPTLVGLLQANVKVPQVPASGDYPLVVTVGGVASPAGLVSVSVP